MDWEGEESKEGGNIGCRWIIIRLGEKDGSQLREEEWVYFQGSVKKKAKDGLDAVKQEGESG